MNFDFEKIDVLEFLEVLGLRNIEDKGTEIFYSCPFPGHSNDDKNPSASMKQGTTVAYCFGCGWKGNALKFLCDYENVSPMTALKWLRQEYGDDFKEPEVSVLAEIDEILRKENFVQQPKIVFLDEEECRRREVDWALSFGRWMGGFDCPRPFAYLLNRGFSPQVLFNFQVGWDSISQRITIPYRWHSGELLGFKARAYDEEQYPRYLVLGGPEYGFEPFQVSTTLFGLEKAYKHKNLIVREGELNAISMVQRGYVNTVGISGKFLSNLQLEQIKRYCDTVCFWFDDEGDAITAAEKTIGYMPSSIIRHTDIDPADMSDDELHEAMATRAMNLLRSYLV